MSVGCHDAQHFDTVRIGGMKIQTVQIVARFLGRHGKGCGRSDAGVHGWQCVAVVAIRHYGKIFAGQRCQTQLGAARTDFKLTLLTASAYLHLQPSGSLRTMSYSVCAGTVVDPSCDTSAATPR